MGLTKLGWNVEFRYKFFKFAIFGALLTSFLDPALFWWGVVIWNMLLATLFSALFKTRSTDIRSILDFLVIRSPIASLLIAAIVSNDNYLITITFLWTLPCVFRIFFSNIKVSSVTRATHWSWVECCLRMPISSVYMTNHISWVFTSHWAAPCLDLSQYRHVRGSYLYP